MSHRLPPLLLLLAALVGCQGEGVSEGSWQGASALRIDAPAAGVELVGVEGDTVRAWSRGLGSLGDADLTASWFGDELWLDLDCGLLGCRSAFRVEVPRDLPLVVDIGVGDLELDDYRGPVELTIALGDADVQDLEGDLVADISSGDLDLDRVSGPLTVDLLAGSVDGRDLTSPSAQVRVFGASPTDLEWIAAPESALIEGDAGSIRVDLPFGAYDCRLDSFTGSVSIDDLRCDDPLGPLIEISSSTGSIRLRGT